MKILDVGSGQNPYEADNAEVVHMDMIKFDHVEVVYDITKAPSPFPDNNFDLIIMGNFLEHISPADTVVVLKECYRLLKQYCEIKITVPYHSSGNAKGDPLHISQFSIQTTRFFDSELTPEHPWRQHNFKFKLTDWNLVFHPWWLRWMSWVAKKAPGFYDYHLCYLIQPAELQFILRKV